MKRVLLSVLIASAALCGATQAWANAGNQGGANGVSWHHGDNPANPAEGAKQK